MLAHGSLIILLYGTGFGLFIFMELEASGPLSFGMFWRVYGETGRFD